MAFSENAGLSVVISKSPSSSIPEQTLLHSVTDPRSTSVCSSVTMLPHTVPEVSQLSDIPRRGSSKRSPPHRAGSNDDALNISRTEKYNAEDTQETPSKLQHDDSIPPKPRVSDQGDNYPDPNMIDWDGPDDPENPKNFSVGRKWLATILCIFMVLCV
jgi:hypothetical protein